MAAPLPLGTNRSGTTAATDAAKCRRFATGFHSLLHPAWAQKQALKRSAESNIYTEKEDIRSSGSGCSDILFLKIHF